VSKLAATSAFRIPDAAAVRATPRKYRGAVIGLGSIARQSHIPGFTHDDATRARLEIVATVDAEPSVAPLEGVPRLGDRNALRTIGDVDFVDICTPTSSHLDLTLWALEEGYHVLCEKPVALTVAEARRIADASRAAGRVVMPCHQYRFNPVWVQLRQWLEQGAIGRWHLAELHVYRLMADRGTSGDPTPWRGLRADAGGGILLDHGTVRTSGTAMHCINEYLHGLRGDDGRYRGLQQGVRFDRMLAPGGLAVVSGEDLTVVVSGTAEIENAPRTWIPAFRIVNATTGTNVHSVTGYQRQITLPTRGEFEYQFTMQMNVPAGRYNIEAFIWDAEANVHAITGPSLQVEVLEGAPFYGAVQMNSRWSVIKSGAAGASRIKSEAPKRHTA